MNGRRRGIIIIFCTYLCVSFEEYELCNKLKSMRFSGMAAELERVFADPNADLMAFNDKIQRIVDAEWDLRYTKKLNRFIKKATLKYATADLLADDYFKTDDILEKRNYFGLLGEFANTSIFDRMGYESNTMSSVFDLFKMGTGTFGGFGI